MRWRLLLLLLADRCRAATPSPAATPMTPVPASVPVESLAPISSPAIASVAAVAVTAIAPVAAGLPPGVALCSLADGGAAFGRVATSSVPYIATVAAPPLGAVVAVIRRQRQVAGVALRRGAPVFWTAGVARPF